MKKRTDPTLNPLDKGDSYVESVANNATTKLGNLISNSSLEDSASTIIEEPLFQPGTSGIQTRPGDGGFAYADTPEATVFVQKREWIEDDWNYVSNSKEREGRKEELQTRVRIGNLITRKLDLLNDHELFSKFSEINATLNSLYNKQVRSNDYENYTLSGSQVTKYYTERLTFEDKILKYPKATITIATTIQVNTKEPGTGGRLLIRNRPDYKAPVLSGIHGPKTNGPSEVIIINTTGEGDVNQPDNVIPGINNIEGSSIPTIDFPEGIDLQKYKSAEFWKIDLTKLPKEYILIRDGDILLEGINTVYGTKPTKEQKQLYVWQKLQTQKVGYVARVNPGRRGNFQLAVPKGIKEIQAELINQEPTVESSNKKTFSNVFNGVIELCNVQNIRTSVKNDGSIGTAELTLVNPSNLLVISDDDIEIALSENPFLDTDQTDITSVDPITGKETKFKYYRGKYYSERGFKLVTRQDLAVIFPTDKSLSSLKSLLSQLETYSELLQGFLQGIPLVQDTYYALSETFPEYGITEKIQVSSEAPDRHRYQNSIQAKLGQINSATLFITLRIKDLEGQSLDSLTNLSETSTESYKYRKNQLKKYFQNRTIFSVYDKIFLWLPSPSRTVRTTTEGTIVSEELTQNSIRAKRVQEIISLIKQFDRNVQSVLIQNNQPVITIFSDDILSIINENLFLVGQSKELDDRLEQVKSAFDNYPAQFQILQDTISQKVNELSNLVLSEDQQATSNNLGSEYTLQGLDPKRIFTQEYSGVVDEQFQVWEGVITNISRSFSNGQFTIQISCQDNLSFLDRSRFIDKPSMNQFATGRAKPILDDPIWRVGKDDFTIEKLSPEIKEALVSAAGRWKTGILSLNASFVDRKEEKSTQKEEGKNAQTNLTNVYPLEVLHSSFYRPLNQAFTESTLTDPANIISVLTTGLPFDLDLYIRSTQFGGSLNVTPKMSDGSTHDGERLAVGPLEGIRQQILGQYSKYGNFQPYFETVREISEEEKDRTNIQTQLKLSLAIIEFIKTYASIRKQYFPKFIQYEQKEYQRPKSGLKELTEDNFDEIIVPSSTFPNEFKTAEDKNIVSLSGKLTNNIEKPLEFILTAALRGETTETVNTLLTQGIDESRINQILNGCGATLRKDKNRRYYSLSSHEQSLFDNITVAVSTRIKQGEIYQILDKARNFGVTKGLEPGSRESTEEFLEELFQFAKSPQSPDNLKEIYKSREKLMHPNRPQKTKASIIAKQQQNFLIISDKYISTEGLTDYVLSIADPGQQENQYSTVLERCLRAAKTIDYEFYVDSQGHIRFRPPSYNRTLLKHFLDLNNVESIYRKLLAKYFVERNATDFFLIILYKGVLVEIEQLKAACYQGIKNLIDEAKTVIMKSDSTILDSLITFGSKSFLTDSLVVSPTSLLGFSIENSVGQDRMRKILAQINTSLESSFGISADEGLFEFELSGTEIKNDINTRLERLLAGGKGDTTNPQTIEDYNNSQEIKVLVDKAYSELAEIQQRFKQEVVEYVNYSDDIRSEIQELNKTISEETKNAIERFVALAKMSSDTIDYIKTEITTLQGKLHPEIQELTDSRFIHNLPSAIIISESYVESSPSFTRLDVYANPTIAGINPSSIEGQQLHWAGSVDYDLWRIYGYKSQSVQVPFLQNAQQATVYAHLLMARQYAEILQGSVTVRGDAKYQVGDCIFIEDENLYFYITGVQHDFAYGQQYTTSLTLAYGRRPGYQIPYPFDVVGKQYTRGANLLYGDDNSLFDSSALNKLIIEGVAKENELLKNPEHNN